MIGRAAKMIERAAKKIERTISCKTNQSGAADLVMLTSSRKNSYRNQRELEQNRRTTRRIKKNYARVTGPL